MVEVTNFLLRWLYLSNMIRFDLPEIQTLPQIYSHHHHHHHYSHPNNHHPYSTGTASASSATVPPPPPPHEYNSYNGDVSQPSSHYYQQHSHSPPPPPAQPSNTQEEEGTQSSLSTEQDLAQWKQKTLESILRWESGTQRLYAIDSIRMQIVQTFGSQLSHAASILQSHSSSSSRKEEEEEEEDPYVDADLEIVEMIQRLMEDDYQGEELKALMAELEHEQELLHDSDDDDDEEEERATLVISKDGTNIETDSDKDDDEEEWDGLGLDKPPPPPPLSDAHPESSHDTLHDLNAKVKSAQTLLTETRTCLPQLVSAVLHSPPPLTPSPILNPLSTLRSLMLKQCLSNPNLGIELCWLLEAEVGRAWKTLFEHRKQTGRRLLVVLTGEKASVKAAVMAKIGSEKRSAFDLLQDAEQATAYGYSEEEEDEVLDEYGYSSSVERNNEELREGSSMVMTTTTTTTPRLPASLSLKRCSHYGDTMQFVDRLTQISMDLRMIPVLQRTAYLRESLYELNRRLRRRMLTKGDVSLDVEDNHSPHDWPTEMDLFTNNHLNDDEHDISSQLQYSVHFPLEPQIPSWAGGDDSTTTTTDSDDSATEKKGMVRVLNVVPTECRILASRERCPFLVQLEVVQTNMDGSDARLYAPCGVNGVGTTVEEAMGIGLSSKGGTRVGGSYGYGAGGGVQQRQQQRSFVPYRIPSELLSTTYDRKDYKRSSKYGGNARQTSSTVRPLLSQRDDNADVDNDDDGTTSDDDNDPTVEDIPTANNPLQSNEYTQSDIPTAHLQSDEYPPTPNKDASSSSSIYPNPNPRGGYQGEEDNYYPPPPHPSSQLDYDGTFTTSPQNPYEILRQEELEQLHSQMQRQRMEQLSYERQEELRRQFYAQQGYHEHHHQQQHRQQVVQPGPPSVPSTPTLTTYSTLLDKVYGLPWSTKCEQIRRASPYGHVKGWKLASFIMKAGEDIRREALMMQIISKLRDWFETDIPVPSQRPYLRPYTIMCVGGDAGMLECLADAKSVDEVKKETDGFTSLRDYFERAYGPPTRMMRGQQQQPLSPGSPSSVPPPLHHPGGVPAGGGGVGTTVGQISFEQAQDNFLRSLVGYSLVCYILQIKDRHNANILLSREGHLIHIDFGFVLGDTPKMGKVPLFSERAPFKLTAEFWDVIGGWRTKEGGRGVDFCKMFEAAFQVASDHADEIASLIEAAMLNFSRNVNEARSIANSVKARLRMRGAKDSPEQKTFIMELVNTALTSWGTSTYDWLQRSMNGYQ